MRSAGNHILPLLCVVVLTTLSHYIALLRNQIGPGRRKLTAVDVAETVVTVVKQPASSLEFLSSYFFTFAKEDA